MTSPLADTIASLGQYLHDQARFLRTSGEQEALSTPDLLQAIQDTHARLAFVATLLRQHREGRDE